MDDLFDAGYVIFIILLFIFSIVKNMAKNKKMPPAKRRTMPPVAPESKKPDDFIERKLAELLGLEVPASELPKPEPQKVPTTPPVKKAPQPRRYPEPSLKEEPKEKKSTQDFEPRPATFRERIIWAEILGPPRARRKGRII